MISVNPYDASDIEKSISTVRSVSAAKVIAFVGLGCVFGLLAAFLSLLAGFHGNFEMGWLYISGPTAWIIKWLVIGDDAYVFVLFSSSVVQWSLYGLVMIAPISSKTLKSILLMIFHVGCAVAFQLLSQI